MLTRLMVLGLAMVVAGFALVALSLAGAWLQGHVSVTGGGCIVVFFVPVCFGFGSPEAVEKLTPLMVLVSLIMLASSALLLVASRRASTAS